MKAERGRESQAVDRDKNGHVEKQIPAIRQMTFLMGLVNRERVREYALKCTSVQCSYTGSKDRTFY